VPSWGWGDELRPGYDYDHQGDMQTNKQMQAYRARQSIHREKNVEARRSWIPKRIMALIWLKLKQNTVALNLISNHLSSNKVITYNKCNFYSITEPLSNAV